MSEGLKKVHQLCEEIGRGRFGTVFRCFFPDSGEFFASKSIDKLLLLTFCYRSLIALRTSVDHKRREMLNG